ncbi:MAG: AarF/UbiB family protein [Planctomycetia bacterium]|nr:AarF/UbiB family protein [Planctomycetia bacterium]
MPISFPFFNTFRNIRRVSEIVGILIRFGLGDFVRMFGLERFYRRSRNLFSKPKADNISDNLTFAKRIRIVFEELGPTFIKFGQILSVRSDILPSEMIQELKLLQDQCVELPFSKIEEILQNNFQGDWKTVFRSIEEKPLAAGSIAQTHRTVLIDGTHAVIKIMRPNIQSIINADLEVLLFIAKQIESYEPNLGFSPISMVQEFSVQLFQELDFQNEAQATERLGRLFADSATVHFPKVYWQATTKEVLTIEEIHGNPISRLDVNNISEKDRQLIVDHLFHAVFRQCFEFGFFHADPHPGNIFVNKDNVVIFIDCGLTCHLDRKTSDLLAGIFYGIVSDNPDRVLNSVVQLADVKPVIAGRRDFYSDISTYVARFQSVPLNQLNISRILQDFFVKLRKYHISCPSDILFLIKTMSLLEGIIASVLPDFNFVEHAKPYIFRLIQRRFSPRQITRELFQTLDSYSRFFAKFPDHIDQAFAMLKQGETQLKLSHEGLEHLDRTITWASWRLANMFFCCSLILAGSILILAECFADQKSLLWEIGLASIFLALGLSLASYFPVWFRK